MKFDKEFAANIVPLMTPVHFESGEIIYEQGIYASTIIILVKGVVEFYIKNPFLKIKENEEK